MKNKFDSLNKKGFNENFKQLSFTGYEIVNLQLNNEGNLIATFCRDGVIRIWDTGKELVIFEFTECVELYFKIQKFNYRCTCIDFSFDSKFLAVGLGVGHLYVFDLTIKELAFEYEIYPDLSYENLDMYSYFAEYTFVKYSESGKYLIVVPSAYSIDPSDQDGRDDHFDPIYLRTVHIIDTSTQKPVFDYIFPKGKIGSVEISKNDNLFSAGILGGDLKVWDLQLQQEVFSANDFLWISNSREIGMRDSIIFLNDNTIAYTTINMSIKIVSNKNKIWSVDQILVNSHCRGMITALAYDHDNKELFSVEETDIQKPWSQRTLIKWNLKDMTVLKIKVVECDFVRKMVVNSENNQILIGYARTIEVRDLTDFNLVEWLKSEPMLGDPSTIGGNGNAFAIGLNESIRYADDSMYNRVL
ncbi:MAG: hypothetical protein GY760_00570 [Deltaproteobacteria bacterium]|nr:hypothetical protein [Deltaproteobacteria bacterium]